MCASEKVPFVESKFCWSSHITMKLTMITIIFRKTVDFEFNFMDRAPLLQDFLSYIIGFYQNGSTVNRDFTVIQHCQRSFESLISGCATLTEITIYYIQHILYMYPKHQNTNTDVYIYTYIYIYISMHTHVCWIWKINPQQWPDFLGRHRRGVSNPSRYLKFAVEKQSVGLGVVAQMVVSNGWLQKGTLKGKWNIPMRI